MTDNQNARRILVTDGEQRASLAVVRSLGAAGHIVHVCASTRHPLAGASRFAKSEYVVANALTNPGRFVDDIRAIISAHNIDTVIPIAESALLALLPQRAQFTDVLIPFTDAETFTGISDKQKVLAAATHVGIAIPRQIVLANALEAEAIHAASIVYPVVVKPARSVTTEAGDRLKLTVQHAASELELRSILERMKAQAFPILLQQRVVGPGIGIFALVWDGILIAQFAHRRIREKPPSGGVSVYRASIAMDPTLLHMSIALLAEFAWRGVAMIEYKVDETTGIPYLMEINGRFWGSLQLAIDAGVDFPNLLIGAATNHSPTPVTHFHTDVRSRWFWGDVDHLVTRLRRSDKQLSLPTGAPSRWRAVRDFFAHNASDKSEIYRRDDARPFLRESIQWFQQLGR